MDRALSCLPDRWTISADTPSWVYVRTFTESLHDLHLACLQGEIQLRFAIEGGPPVACGAGPLKANLKGKVENRAEGCTAGKGPWRPGPALIC